MLSGTSEMQAILERLARLERQSRRLKRGLLATVGAVGALVLMAQAKPKSTTIEAQAFILRDDKATYGRNWEHTPPVRACLSSTRTERHGPILET